MKKLAFLFFIFMPLLAYAQYEPYHDIALYNAGQYVRAIPSAQINVCAAGDTNIPCVTPVTIYTSSAGTQTLATCGTGCFNADLNGNYQFFVASGNYTVTVTGAGYTGFSNQIAVGVGGGGGSMTWPGVAGVPCYSGSSSWCASYTSSNQIPNNILNPDFSSASFLKIPDTAVPSAPNEIGVTNDNFLRYSTTQVSAVVYPFVPQSFIVGDCPQVAASGSTIYFADTNHPCGPNIFSSFQVQSYTPITSYGNYIEFVPGTNVTISQGGAGTSGSPYVVTITASSSLGSVWSSLTGPSTSLILSMNSNLTEWQYGNNNQIEFSGSGGVVLQPVSPTLQLQNSAIFELSGSYEATSGPTYAQDSWGCLDSIGSGVNGTSTLSCTHSGSTGLAAVSFPNIEDTTLTTYGVPYSQSGLLEAIYPAGLGIYSMEWNWCSTGSAPSAVLAGLAVRDLASSDTVACSDVGSQLEMPASGPSANYALSLPTPTTLDNSSFYTRICDFNATYDEVVSPVGSPTWTINGNATLTIDPNQCYLISTGSSGGTNWHATVSTTTVPSGTFTAGGDLSGSSSSQQVIGMHFGSNGYTLSSTALSSGQCIGYNGTNILGVTCGSGSGWPTGTLTPSAATAVTYGSGLGSTDDLSILGPASTTDTGFVTSFGTQSGDTTQGAFQILLEGVQQIGVVPATGGNGEVIFGIGSTTINDSVTSAARFVFANNSNANNNNLIFTSASAPTNTLLGERSEVAATSNFNFALFQTGANADASCTSCTTEFSVNGAGALYAASETLGAALPVGSGGTGNTSGLAAGLSGCSPSTAGSICYWNGSAWTLLAGNASGTNWLQETSSGVPSWTTPSTSGISFPVSISGTVNSGGIPYFNSITQMSSSAALTQYGIMYGGGAGNPPTVIAPPTTNGFYSCGYNVTASAAVAPTCLLESGGSVIYTTSQTLSLSNNDQLIIAQCASACSITLPSTPPATTWNVAIQWPQGATGPVSIVSNGPNLYLGSETATTSSFQIPTASQTIFITTDGTNYYANAPFAAGTNVTFTPGTQGLSISASGVTAEPQYDVAYYTQSGTTAQVGGAAINGFQFDSTTGAPAAATATNLGTLADLAQYDIVLSGGTSAALTGLAPSSTTGAILASGGSSANPAYDASAKVSGAALTMGASGTAGTYVMYPSSGNFTTTLGSAATASNTVLFPASVPTTLDGLHCVVSSTTCTLTDNGYAYNAIPLTDMASIAAYTVLANPNVTSGAPVATINPSLGVPGVSSGTLGLAYSGSGGATTILGTVATTTNTVDFFAAVPTNLHLFYCAVSSTTCTLTDAGYAYNAIPNADVSGLGALALVGYPSAGVVYSSGSALSDATGSQVSAVIQGLTGCTTANYVFVPEGNDCVAQSGGGSGTVSSSTVGYIAQYTGATTVGTPSPLLDNGVTTANTLSYGGSAGEALTSSTAKLIVGTSPVVPLGSASAILMTEGTAPVVGPFTISGGSWSSSVETITITSAAASNPIGVGESVLVTSNQSGANGTFTVTAIGGSTTAWTFSYSLASSPGTVSSGTVSAPQGSDAVYANSVNHCVSVQNDGIDQGCALSTGHTSGLLSNYNTSQQSQVTVAATPYYIAGSNINVPTTLYTGYSVGTSMWWRIAGMQKNGDGTGATTFILYVGTTGSTSDTQAATVAWGSAGTAVADNASVDIMETITGITGGTATVYYAITPEHHLATTGWSTSAGNAGFSETGTFTFNTATSGLVFGLGFQIASGGTMPTVTINQVQAHASKLF
jgi:hypothetical protein